MKKFFLLLTLFCLSSVCFAQDLLDMPKPKSLIEDKANIFTSSERYSMEQSLMAINDSTSTQIMILTLSDLEGNDASSLATDLGHKWGVGQDGKDNGILILIKPKLSQRDRGQVFIAVGYGLEGIIPDAIAKTIVDKEMLPFFSRGMMYRGVSSAIDVLASLASKEFTAKEYVNKKANPLLGGMLSFMFVIFIFAIISLSSRRRTVVDGKSFETRSSILPWLLLGSMGNGGGFGGGSSGGGFGGGGGGGFGGFGGGGFGGGGAGGSW
ncbi:MAG: TPM domain-containing protein [Bacteroidetes bacterium]|nr:TPM domain-containing protein [Bacteroidota bacterium]